jgi:hypothetical protein
MGLPNQFNDVISKHLGVNAAWLPVTNTFELGDYGIFSGGVFVKMGNIKEYNVTFDHEQAPDATIDFTSAHTKVLKFAAGAQVSVIPSGAVDAKVKFKFESENSFLVKAPVIRVDVIQNLHQVAKKLKNTKEWEKKWKVVFKVHHAVNPVILSSKTAGTEVSFSGDVKALQALDVGNASLEFGSNKELGLKVLGKEGIIGLGLFKLKLIGSGVSVMRDPDAPVEVDYLDPKVSVDDI